MKIYTIGFTEKSAQKFFELLKSSGAARIVDVRLSNSSQLAGFAKKADLAWFARELCAMDYVHMPELAPSPELFDKVKGKALSWQQFEADFLDLMRARRVEETAPRALLDNSVLLCSEAEPDHCHRRFVAEYLQRHWEDVEIVHL